MFQVCCNIVEILLMEILIYFYLERFHFGFHVIIYAGSYGTWFWICALQWNCSIVYHQIFNPFSSHMEKGKKPCISWLLILEMWLEKIQVSHSLESISHFPNEWCWEVTIMRISIFFILNNKVEKDSYLVLWKTSDFFGQVQKLTSKQREGSEDQQTDVLLGIRKQLEKPLMWALKLAICLTHTT